LCPSEGERLMRKQRAAGEWLEARLPALVGPHAWRAWVQYGLREIVRSPVTMA